MLKRYHWFPLLYVYMTKSMSPSLKDQSPNATCAGYQEGSMQSENKNQSNPEGKVRQ